MTGPETPLLLSYLNGQRDHVLGILDGLDDDQLRRPVLPSGWSCLSLVHHLAEDVERFWFQGVVAGLREAQGSDDEPDGWQVPEGVSPSSVLDLYRTRVAESNRIIAATPFGTPPAWTPPYFPNPHRDLTQTMLHVLTETSCHAGHLDAVRELIDGRRWLVL
ncbi:DinB family protein [Kineosporia sp. J2-2]|uniref:DinB family protein n=1 Tax=Kineosporia corallincola TaxID=2835133 RepID=A0ABS5TI46_9ACTN|nr:DinB family protein [Kineosporia corallincola]MBT0770750.1 DinB family protein [Kineosporia corallincola]